MAYADLQDFLARLESSGKLHWIEQRVDPAWEVSAITRHVFDRYGWDERPALGFSPCGATVRFLWSSAWSAARRRFTRWRSPRPWKTSPPYGNARSGSRSNRQGNRAAYVKKSSPRARQSTSASCPRWFGRRAKILAPTSPRLLVITKDPKPAGATSAPTACR